MKLVLLPGMDGTGLLFRPLLDALRQSAPGLEPVVVSYPGDRPLSYEALLPIARAALPKRGPYVVVGESMSGPIALRLAAEKPKRLRGVVLAASFVTNPVPYIPRAARHLAQGPLFAAIPFWWRIRGLLGRHASPELVGLFQGLNGRVAPEVMAARAREILSVDARDALHACTVPILYLAGSHDRVVPPRNMRLIRRLRPDVRVVTLPASHLVLQVAAHAAAKELASFAASLDDA